MANKKHLEILKKGVKEWNKWREENPEEQPDLIGANLIRAFLREADLRAANLSMAKLNNANLESANLVETNFTVADLANCRIYGISAWNILLDKNTKQTDLIITRKHEPKITVDNLEVAQFIYLLIHDKKIRDIIDTITTKVVLILGRFIPTRKAVLDAIRDELRKRDYIPVLFDFEKPASKDLHGTVNTLANLAKFVIADITSPRSIPQELISIVPVNPQLPVAPILKKGSKPWSMFGRLKKYPWVLEIYKYKDIEGLLASIEQEIIIPAEAKVEEVRKSIT